MARRAAVASLPDFLTQPLPHYGRLTITRVEDSDVGPFAWATVVTGGRRGSLTRDWVVDWLCDGASALGFPDGQPLPVRAGAIDLDVSEQGGTVTLKNTAGELFARATMANVLQLSPHLIGFSDIVFPTCSDHGIAVKELNFDATPSAAWADRNYALEFGPGAQSVGDLQPVDLIAAMWSRSETARITISPLAPFAPTPIIPDRAPAAAQR